MGYSNIKLSSEIIMELKKMTGENTGQKAVEKALKFFKRNKKQQEIVEELKKISFSDNYNPLDYRKNDR